MDHRISEAAPGGRVLALADLVRVQRAQRAVRRAPLTALLVETVDRSRDLVGAADGRAVFVDVDPDADPACREAARTGNPALVDGGRVLVVPVLVQAGGAVVVQIDAPDGVLFSQVDVELVQLVCQVASFRLELAGAPGDDDLLRWALVSSVDEGVIVTRGPQQRVVLVSEVLEHSLAASPHRMEGRPVSLRDWSWLDEDGTLRAPEEMPTWRAYRTGEAVVGERMRMVPADGGDTTGDPTRWVVVSAYPVPDPLTGHADAVVTRVRDVTAEHHLEQVRREEADQLHAAQQVAGLAWITLTVETGAITWSDEMYRIAGLDPLGPRITVEAFREMLHPEDAHLLALDQDLVGRMRRLVRARLRRPDGGERVVQVWTDEDRDDAGRLTLLRAAVLDVTEHERTVRVAADARRHFELAFDGAPYGMLVVSVAEGSTGRVLRVNNGLAEMVQRPVEAIGGQVESVLVCADDGAEHSLDAARLRLAGVEGDRLVRRLRRADGQVVHVWITVVPVLDSTAAEPFLVVHVLDVTAQFQQQRALERIALTDAVTGLANRAMVTVRIDQALATGVRPLALLMVDLDRFKTVNDSVGHQVGDLLLVSVAERLRAAVPAGALVARLGGDEFVVLLQGETADAAEDVASGLVVELNRPYDLASGHRLVSSASVGVAVVPDAGSTRLDLLRDADLALYRAKELGRNQFVVCDDDLHERAEERLRDEQRLRAGLAGGWLRLHLQPVHDLATGGLSGFEALVRLDDPELGVLEPERFVPVAEETGLVAEIDHWMIGAVLDHLDHDPRLLADPGLRVAVNVSGRTLERPDFSPRLREALERHGTDPHRVALEITESCLLDDADGGTLAALRELRSLGLTVCIDDFGTGYSALSYLQTFEVDVLKVDRRFVAALSGPGEQARATMHAIITMAHALGLVVVAEGVESDEQRDTLVGLGCDLGQGWLFGRPVQA